jgi:hypothetical protein
MSRNFKVMGLALVAAMALTAVMASAAGAATYTSNKPHTIISGSQTTNHVFRATGGFAGISCTTASFEGTAESEAAATQHIIPTYSGCTDTLGRTVDIDNAGLTYVFNGATVTVSGKITLTITNGSKTVVCTDVVEGGHEIIKEGEEEITTTHQIVNGISYSNLGGTNGVEVITESNNVVNTVSGGILNCGVTNGKKTNGTYEGATVIKGVGTDGNPATISVD